MTTREELIRIVLDLSEEEADPTLRPIDRRDPLARWRDRPSADTSRLVFNKNVRARD